MAARPRRPRGRASRPPGRAPRRGRVRPSATTALARRPAAARAGLAAALAEQVLDELGAGRRRRDTGSAARRRGLAALAAAGAPRDSPSRPARSASASPPRTGRRAPSRPSSPQSRRPASTSGGRCAVGGEQRERDRQVEVVALLAQVGGREVDGHRPRRQVEAAVGAARAHALAALAHGGVGQPDDLDLRQTRSGRRPRSRPDGLRSPRAWRQWNGRASPARDAEGAPTFRETLRTSDSLFAAREPKESPAALPAGGTNGFGKRPRHIGRKRPSKGVGGLGDVGGSSSRLRPPIRAREGAMGGSETSLHASCDPGTRSRRRSRRPSFYGLFVPDHLAFAGTHCAPGGELAERETGSLVRAASGAAVESDVAGDVGELELPDRHAAVAAPFGAERAWRRRRRAGRRAAAASGRAAGGPRGSAAPRPATPARSPPGRCSRGASRACGGGGAGRADSVKRIGDGVGQQVVRELGGDAAAGAAGRSPPRRARSVSAK